MCHWMSTQLVPLWIFRFQTWGLLFKPRWRIWNKMFFVWLPWPALWLLKLLGVEFETWWLLQPSESLNGSPLRHHCCLKGVLRGLEVYRSRLRHLPLPLSLSLLILYQRLLFHWIDKDAAIESGAYLRLSPLWNSSGLTLSMQSAALLFLPKLCAVLSRFSTCSSFTFQSL